MYFVLTRQRGRYETRPAFTLLTALLKARLEVACGAQLAFVVKIKKIKGGTEWQYWEVTKHTTFKDIWGIVFDRRQKWQ